ncbi:MAG: redox-sensing transcriptional repressor Rex [Actinomycetota bacterium]
MKRKKIPQTTIARLPLYLRHLLKLARKGVRIISSYELAEHVGTNAAQLRKDLSYLGEFGTRGVGYDVGELIRQISKCLGLTREWKVAIVGMGKLGPALLGYKGFEQEGFKIVAIFDKNPKKIGKKMGNLVVSDVTNLKEVIEKVGGVDIGIITTPASAAQKVADQLIEAGIRAILNFAPVTLEVPSHVFLRQVDLSTELQILSYYLTRPFKFPPPCGYCEANRDL